VVFGRSFRRRTNLTVFFNVMEEGDEKKRRGKEGNQTILILKCPSF
jgi:hypothetical protein